MDHLCFLRLVFLMLLRLFIAALWSPDGKGLTSWLLLVMFIERFVTFPCGILGEVWYLIVSFPDLCILSYFGSHFSPWYTLIIQMQRLGIILGVIPRRNFFCGSFFFLLMFHVCLYYTVLFVPYSRVTTCWDAFGRLIKLLLYH